jgi:hypothetical protein
MTTTGYRAFDAELADLLDQDNPPTVSMDRDGFGPIAELTYDDGSMLVLFITSGGAVGLTDGTPSDCAPCCGN